MAKYKEITLSLGRWQYPKDDVTEIKFKGRRIAAWHEFGDPTSAIRSRGIDWDMYETEDGKYILTWENWSCAWMTWASKPVEPDISDYVKLNRLPGIGERHLGTIFKHWSEPTPKEIVEQALKTLGVDDIYDRQYPGYVTKDDEPLHRKFRLEVGKWYPEGANDVRKIEFAGRKLADGTRVFDRASGKYRRGTDFEVYQTEGCKYLIYWRHWSYLEGEPEIADYAIIQDFPKYDEEYKGEILGDISGRIPYEILDEALQTRGFNPVKYLRV